MLKWFLAIVFIHLSCLWKGLCLPIQSTPSMLKFNDRAGVLDYDCNHNLCNAVENLNGFTRLSLVIHKSIVAYGYCCRNGSEELPRLETQCNETFTWHGLKWWSRMSKYQQHSLNDCTWNRNALFWRHRLHMHTGQPQCVCTWMCVKQTFI